MEGRGLTANCKYVTRYHLSHMRCTNYQDPYSTERLRQNHAHSVYWPLRGLVPLCKYEFAFLSIQYLPLSLSNRQQQGSTNVFQQSIKQKGGCDMLEHHQFFQNYFTSNTSCRLHSRFHVTQFTYNYFSAKPYLHKFHLQIIGPQQRNEDRIVDQGRLKDFSLPLARSY